ncbi:MAG: YHS domain protein [Deltaproteobacteria bacterium]|jgi:YHS domain-containing protein|nr:YHS domain protein [Deltaproteobacteria bacterium]
MTHSMTATRWTLALLSVLAFAAPAAALDPIYTRTLSSLALGGYDPVAYFEAGKPTEGSDRFETKWRGATWRFASAEHLAAFVANPEAFAPQFGGYCAYAVSQGATAPGSSMAWKIVDGKLYLNVNARIQRRWEQDLQAYIARAEARWPELLAAD